MNALDQDGKLRDGTEKVARLVVLYGAIQKQIIDSNVVQNVDFEKTLIQLYSKILSFQIKAVCHYIHRTPMRMVSDVVTIND
jgi:N-terminal domain of NWD NACHT-NTPase